MAEVDGDPATFGDLLNFLFETVHPADRRPYSNEEVASAISDDGGTRISATYLWYLRKGYRDNPTIKHVEALASFFGVPAAYFFNEDTKFQVTRELKLVQALKSVGAQKLALRAGGLSDKSIESLLEMTDCIRELEGLPKTTDK